MTNQLPAFLQQYKRGGASTALDSLTKMSLGSQPYISIKNNTFRAIDSVGEEQAVGGRNAKTGLSYVDAVIIGANEHVSKVYYDKPYDPSASDYMPPTCWSDNGIAPSTQAQAPQCRSCAECPHAAWGSSTSKLTGKQTKACNDVKKIAVFVPELGGMGAFLLRVPPASLKELSNYARTLAANGATVAQVITRISFAPEGVGMLLFTAVNWIDQNMVTAIDAIDDAKLDLLVGANDVARTGELPAPTGLKALSSPQTQQGNTRPPAEPPKEMFEAKSEPAGESEFEAAKRQIAELQAKLAAQGEQVEPKTTRTRRTKAEMEAARAAETGKSEQTVTAEQGMFGAKAGGQDAAGEEPVEIPAFLNGGKSGATTKGIGMEAAQEASPELQAALDKAFSLDLK